MWMQGDLHGSADAVPGDLVSRLVHRGHDRIRWLSSADQKPQPSLIGERDTGASPPVEVNPGDVKDGRSGLIDKRAQVGALDPLRRFGGEVPGAVPPAAGGDLGNGREPCSAG